MEKYINRAVLYTVYQSNELNLNLKRSNIVSIIKGKNYKFINMISSNFKAYKLFKNLSSSYIERSFRTLLKHGYIEESFPDEKTSIVSITPKGLKKLNEFVGESNFLDFKQEDMSQGY